MQRAAHDVLPRFEHVLRRGNYRKNEWRTWHYCTVVAAFFGPVLFRLHGFKPNKKNYHTFSLTGACTALFDRIYDEDLIDPQRFKDVLENPKIADSILEKLIIAFLTDLLDESYHSENFSKLVLRMAHIQELSKNQEDLFCTKDFLNDITMQKGGNGYLIYRSMVPKEIEVFEEEALMQIGKVVQMLDDLVDAWQDANDGIKTLAHVYETPALYHKSIIHEAWLMEDLMEKAGWKNRKQLIFRYALRYCVMIGGIYASRITATLKAKKCTLIELNKSEAMFRTGPVFWIKLVRSIIRDDENQGYWV